MNKSGIPFGYVLFRELNKEKHNFFFRVKKFTS